MNDFFSKIKDFCRRHPIIANLVLMVIVACALIWAVMLFLDVWTHHGSNSTVPQIKGLTYNEAKLVLAENDMSIEISDSIFDRNAAPGTVLESWPKAGAVVKKGRQVFVTVTAFSPKLVTIGMPVIGVSSRQAVTYLEGLGITSIRIVSVPSQYPDLVENAYADGKTLTVGAAIPVTASVTVEVGSAPIDTFETDSLDIAVGDAIDQVDFIDED